MSTKQFGPNELMEITHKWELEALLCGSMRDYTRQHVMGEIRKLLLICYNYGISPLSGLRKVFPELEWKHWRLLNGKDFVREEVEESITETADFVWMISRTEFVTARRFASPVEKCNLFFLNAGGNIFCLPRRRFSLSCLWIF
ncbi:MAG: hypothetical protein AAB649_00540 [Patescibacteria group bacterium]